MRGVRVPTVCCGAASSAPTAIWLKPHHVLPNIRTRPLSVSSIQSCTEPAENAVDEKAFADTAGGIARTCRAARLASSIMRLLTRSKNFSLNLVIKFQR